jgi:hypothetical protein
MNYCRKNMKFLKQKRIAFIFLVAAMLFLGVQKVKADTCSAIPTGGCDSSNSQRTCYCSGTSVSTDTSKNTISSLGATPICCSQFQDACITACKNANYVSVVLVDPGYGLNTAANALSNISMLTANASTPTVPTAAPTAAVPTATSSQIQSGSIPGTSVNAGSGIVQCGRPGQQMCTLCDLIKGFNTVIQYIMKIAIGVALLAMAIGGVLYIVSAGESAMMEKAKSAITNAAIGFVIVFAAFLIINTTMQYLGTIKTNGEPTLGIAIISWGQFDCTANPNR